MKIFLSGGTRTNWHDQIIERFPQHVCFDPRTLRALDMTTIAQTERRWLDECDVLFFYFEVDNPSGIGSAFEVGYSAANSKPVIFVDEKRTSHTEWLAVHCSRTLHTLEEGIIALEECILSMTRSNDEEARDILARLQLRDFSVLSKRKPLHTETLKELARLLRPHQNLYLPLLTATLAMPRYRRGGYDWNLGFLVRGLNPEHLATVLDTYGEALLGSEGVAWGLGELGSDDDRIVHFLYRVCEACTDYHAWWCAGVALEKIGMADSVDILKRTLKGQDFDDLQLCFSNLAQRPARIGVLRLARFDNLETEVVPKCIEALDSKDPDIVENAVWLLERLHVSENRVIQKLLSLMERAEDVSDSLRPRIVEALGEIATESCRSVLEDSLINAKYYRTRAYAANGLKLVSNQASLPILERALVKEKESTVVPYITEALYALKDPDKRRLVTLSREASWPENGLISDQSNRWYGAPEVYDDFSQAEDPENIAFSLALSLIPQNTKQVIDIGTGTGRFASFIAKQRADIDEIIGTDLSTAMVDFLKRKIMRESALRRRLSVISVDTTELPFNSNQADCIVSSWAFPSSMWNPVRCLEELKKVKDILKPSGSLITVGWDESFEDELSEFWYRFVPEPDFQRETLEEWRRRRRLRLHSPRNCHLTFWKTNLKVPLRFQTVENAAKTLGYLFGYSAGQWVLNQQRREFSIKVGITFDNKTALNGAIEKLQNEIAAGDSTIRVKQTLEAREG